METFTVIPVSCTERDSGRDSGGSGVTAMHAVALGQKAETVQKAKTIKIKETSRFWDIKLYYQV